MLLSALVSTIWFFIEIGFQNMPWSYGFLSVALFYFALVRRRSVLLFLTAVVTALTYAETLLGYIIGGSKQVVTIDSIHLFFTVAAFLVLNTIATLLTEREHQTRLADYGIALKAWVARFGAVTLLILSFEGSWKELIREANSDAGMILGTVAVYALVHGAGLFFLWRRELGDKTRFFWNHFSSIALGVCFVLLSLLVCVVPRDTAILLVVVSNLAVMGTGIWLILAAVRNGTQSRFYLGVLLLICLALIRYFDLFGGYIGGAAAFFIAGAMLFASARYWRRSSTHTSNTGVLA